MTKFILFFKVIFGLFFLTISSFIGLIIVLVIIGKDAALGVNLKAVILFLRGSDGTISMIPIFMGILAIAGVLLIKDSDK